VTGDSLLLALIITYIKNTWHIGKKLMWNYEGRGSAQLTYSVVPKCTQELFLAQDVRDTISRAHLFGDCWHWRSTYHPLFRALTSVHVEDIICAHFWCYVIPREPAIHNIQRFVRQWGCFIIWCSLWSVSYWIAKHPLSWLREHWDMIITMHNLQFLFLPSVLGNIHVTEALMQFSQNSCNKARIILVIAFLNYSSNI
jgi:hypothetical protein